jgi:hypothetical protein
MSSLIPAHPDELDPIQRVEYDMCAVQTWRITWSDGTAEDVAAHHMMWVNQMIAFAFTHHGTHRLINPQHMRDIQKLPSNPDDGQ